MKDLRIRKASTMGRGNLLGKMEICMKGSSKVGSSMAKANFSIVKKGLILRESFFVLEM
jgi:hypothetical protein